jgi:DNA topoisomerase-1
VASRLGNTPTICRKCYIHPELMAAYTEGQLLLEIRDQAEGELRDQVASLKPEEAAVLALLKARLDRTLADDLKDSLAAVPKRPRRCDADSVAIRS